MQNTTREIFNAAMSQLAAINKVATVSQQFTVEPSVQQTLETKIQQSSEFLSKINIYLVRDMKGKAVGMGIARPIASRTNTDSEERTPTDPTALDERQYECHKTDFDTAIKYAKLDQWAKFPYFYNRFRNTIIHRQALDRIMIGFNGKSVASKTNLDSNPKLQDVNKGWLQKQREENSARVLKEGSESGKIRIGNGGDYHNLDALVMNLVDEMIDEVHQSNPDLVVMTGRKMAADKYFPLVNKEQPNSEALAADLIISQKRMGNLPVYTVPFMPDGVILVTTFDNLSIYVQEGARRRTVIDNPRRDQIENFESSNEGYFIEDLGLCAMAENIELVA
ncbi:MULTISPECIES: phage major capsid protein, P2 family [Moraxella]|uniref:Phage major capsid protein n=1 Tax=Moraxella catarrhalis TaxID=480 RepID=A0A7Z1A3J9_MORCA|nr:phage major capsid protein, P2 family [Moraxella catarrhalis]OAV00210.1 Phage major capsid protein [Moraxella catarrhalis]STY82478.1 phage major capsid protein, P2 family [Moraxella catarrhalis]